jgi:hypothetical protein
MESVYFNTHAIPINACFWLSNILEMPFPAPVFSNFGHLCYIQFGVLSKAILHMYICMHKGYVCLMKKVHNDIKRISVDLVRIYCVVIINGNNLPYEMS